MGRGFFKVEGVDNSVERRILIGAITSDEFVMELHNLLVPTNFAGDMPKILISWIMDYYTEFHKAPGENIRALYDYASIDGDENEMKICREYLLSLSKDFVTLKNFNAVHAVNESYVYLKEKAIRHKLKLVEKMLDKGMVNEASEAMVKIPEEIYKDSDRSLSTKDPEEFISSFYGKTIAPLFEFSEAHRNYLPPPMIKRLNVFLGPGKRGKSFHLQCVAEEALTNGFNVLYFSLEMPKEQMSQRFVEGFTGRAHKEEIQTNEYLVPVWDCTKNRSMECPDCAAFKALTEDSKYEDNKDHVVCSSCRYDNPSNWSPCTWLSVINRKSLGRGEAKTVLSHINRIGGSIKIESGSFSVPEMRAIARRHTANGFDTKIVLIDYGDIIADSSNFSEFRHNSSNNWRGLSNWCKEDGLSMWTATQGTRSAFSADRLVVEHIAENIEIARIIDSLIGINSLNESDKEPHKRDSYWKRQMMELILCRFAEGGKMSLVLNDFSRSVVGFDSVTLR